MSTLDVIQASFGHGETQWRSFNRQNPMIVFPSAGAEDQLGIGYFSSVRSSNHVWRKL
ncbi:hypothetical protein KC19_3G136000 [Ceratodon purpureus]|uniref:Uncharacterized protein n=1 Tax=Ceratodon purpureus TaxID=3225 RepID=A0A8T0IJH0_CERPU|nr:hypothetical protein KC19_3G136000 [Ceratodon purpureus]